METTIVGICMPLRGAFFTDGRVAGAVKPTINHKNTWFIIKLNQHENEIDFCGFNGLHNFRM